MEGNATVSMKGCGLRLRLGLQMWFSMMQENIAAEYIISKIIGSCCT